MGGLLSAVFGARAHSKTARPDFASPVYWLAHPVHHPERIKAALPRASIVFEPGVKVANATRTPMDLDDCQATAPADVFFLHGTMEAHGNQASIFRYETEEWSGFNTHHQMKMITAFTNVCRAFAPLYRQASFFGDWGLAYEDVLAAFEQYLVETPELRPLILAGHSQGSMHLERLVRERVATDAQLLARVAGVFAPGAAIWSEGPALRLERGAERGAEGSAEGAEGACGDAAEGQCGARAPGAAATVALWATATPEATLEQTLVGHVAKGGGSLAAFADPGSWGPAGGLGVLLRDEKYETLVYHGLVERTELQGGLLRLHPRPGTEALLKKLSLGGHDYHPYDVHLFWGNIRRRVQQQVEAHLAAGAAAAASGAAAQAGSRGAAGAEDTAAAEEAASAPAAAAEAPAKDTAAAEEAASGPAGADAPANAATGG